MPEGWGRVGENGERWGGGPFSCSGVQTSILVVDGHLGRMSWQHFCGFLLSQGCHLAWRGAKKCWEVVRHCLCHSFPGGSLPEGENIEKCVFGAFCHLEGFHGPEASHLGSASCKECRGR